MEPQIIDFYNEMPHSVNVINKLNEEFNELQNSYEIMKKKLKKYEMHKPPIVYFNNREELDSLIINCKEIIKNNLNKEEIPIGCIKHGFLTKLGYIICRGFKIITKEDTWSWNESFSIMDDIGYFIEGLKVSNLDNQFFYNEDEFIYDTIHKLICLDIDHISDFELKYCIKCKKCNKNCIYNNLDDDILDECICEEPET